MPRRPKRDADDATELLKDILIVQLGMAGVRQQDIRAIVGCDINRVSRIVRHIKTKVARDEED